MTGEKLEREAIGLHAKYPGKTIGRTMEWEWLVETSKEYWRDQVRNGERAPAPEPETG